MASWHFYRCFGETLQLWTSNHRRESWAVSRLVFSAASTKHIALLEEKIQLGTLPVGGGDGVKRLTKRVDVGCAIIPIYNMLHVYIIIYIHNAASGKQVFSYSNIIFSCFIFSISSHGYHIFLLGSFRHLVVKSNMHTMGTHNLHFLGIMTRCHPYFMA